MFDKEGVGQSMDFITLNRDKCQNPKGINDYESDRNNVYLKRKLSKDRSVNFVVARSLSLHDLVCAFQNITSEDVIFGVNMIPYKKREKSNIDWVRSFIKEEDMLIEVVVANNNL